MNFNLNERLIYSLLKNGITEPTDIQRKVIPEIIDNKSLIVQSQTGSGKTLSFLIPLLNRIFTKKDISVLILAPTRELVLQISDEAKKIIKYLNNNDDTEKTINILPIYGGKDIKSQTNKLKNNIDILVATPGRLIDHINRKNINLKNFSTIVLDEADQMLLMGFRSEIDIVLKNIEKINQIILLSATIDPKVKKIAYMYSDKIDIITSKYESIPDTINQEFIFTDQRNKFDSLVSTLKRDNPFLAIIFCRTKNRVDNLNLKLAQNGFNCDKIHSDLSQSKRERILKDFRNMKLQFLISTDIASRGLDIEGLTHIYNYDFPENPDDYVHRIGRTGRIGNIGSSISFITEKDNEVYEKVKEILDKK